MMPLRWMVMVQMKGLISVEDEDEDARGDSGVNPFVFFL